MIKEIDGHVLLNQIHLFIFTRAAIFKTPHTSFFINKLACNIKIYIPSFSIPFS
jgi:hypothetical protein